MSTPIVVTYDKRLYKKCIKCRQWLPREDIQQSLEEGGGVLKRRFGYHETSGDGLQSICYSCKNVANAAKRQLSPGSRIRHHTSTRCMTQLGAAAPKGFVKDMEKYLGYRIAALVKHLGADLKEREGSKRKLRDALNEGYHIDHIKPLSSFAVVVDGEVDWEVFQECWAIENLTAIPGDENLAKGAKFDG